jgi:hypothetical protein
MNQLKIYLVALSLIFVFGCDEDVDNSIQCNNSTSEFQSIFKNMLSSGYEEDVSFDTEIHEYTFTLSADREVCKIGYQSQPGISSTPYLIEIVDNSKNVIIYSNNHTFSSTTTSYVTPTSTINLQSGLSYTIRRIQTNWKTDITFTIGRLARKNQMDFPYSSGIMTITTADFYQRGGPLTELAVPYIDLIFK